MESIISALMWNLNGNETREQRATILEWDDVWKLLEQKKWKYLEKGSTCYYMPPGIDATLRNEKNKRKLKYKAGVDFFTTKVSAMEYIQRKENTSMLNEQSSIGEQQQVGSEYQGNGGGSSSNSSSSSSSSSNSNEGHGNKRRTTWQDIWYDIKGIDYFNNINGINENEEQEHNEHRNSWRKVLSIKSLQNKLLRYMDEDKHISFERPKVQGVNTYTDEQNKLFCAALEFGANDIFREMEDNIYYFANNRMVSMRLMTKSCHSETCNKLIQLIEFFQEQVPCQGNRTRELWEQCLNANF